MSAGRRDESGPERRREAAGSQFRVLPHFERFNQRDDMFCRSFWDDEIRSPASELFYRTYRKPLANWRSADGFTQRDYSLRNASWHVTDVFAELKEDEDRREGFLDEFTLLRDGAETRVEVESPEAMSVEIKHVAKSFGADLVGVAAFDERWVYTNKYSATSEQEKPNEIPEGINHAIVIANEMDYELVQTVPSALSGAATGLGYSHDAMTLLSLAQYIRNLGYRAIPTMNDTALAIPLAIEAGLGEYGRLGLLITKEYGPRVRLGKIFTDLPLANDRPVRFGVEEFCNVCSRCADMCPVQAIPNGPPSAEVHSRSNIVGVEKWTLDAEKCFGFWAKQNSDCSICIRVCPYNKPYPRLLYRAGRWLAGTFLRRAMLALDVALGYGQKARSQDWWGRG